MNKAKLKSLIVLHDGNQESLADAMGVSLSRLNAKINENNAEFTQREIDFIIRRYCLNDADVMDIFFK
jgi:hypothetical protein